MARDERLTVAVTPAEDDDAVELSQLTSLLQRELLTLDVADVRPVESQTAPEGAKGIGSVVGMLAVQLGSIEGLRVVIDLVRGWAGRSRREVEVTIGGDTLRLSGVSSGEQERIVDAWLARHATGT